MDSDRFKKMWDQQEAFMHLLQQKRNFPQFPLDLSKKSDQKYIKGITHECMHELFESNVLLKAKDHRATDMGSVDRDAYIEEVCDAFHYLLEVLILAGVSPEEFYRAYMKKGEVNVERISNGY